VLRGTTSLRLLFDLTGLRTHDRQPACPQLWHGQHRPAGRSAVVAGL